MKFPDDVVERVRDAMLVRSPYSVEAVGRALAALTAEDLIRALEDDKRGFQLRDLAWNGGRDQAFEEAAVALAAEGWRHAVLLVRAIKSKPKQGDAVSEDGAYPPGCTQEDHDRAYGDNDLDRDDEDEDPRSLDSGLRLCASIDCDNYLDVEMDDGLYCFECARSSRAAAPAKPNKETL